MRPVCQKPLVISSPSGQIESAPRRKGGSEGPLPRVWGDGDVMTVGRSVRAYEVYAAISEIAARPNVIIYDPHIPEAILPPRLT